MEHQLIACPVCTLFLREGMSMQSHLNTHPKDQVIDALVRICQSGPRTYTTHYTPPAIINPLHVVSEEHTLLFGRQQVITNTIHAPFMGYPIYPNQHIIGGTGEYNQSELQLNVAGAENGVVATVLNYSNHDIYNRQNVEIVNEEEEEEAQKLAIQQSSQFQALKPVEIQQYDIKNVISEEQHILTIGGNDSPMSRHSDPSHHSDDEPCHSEDILNMDEQEHHYMTEEVVEDHDAKTQTEDVELELSCSGINIEANERMPPRGELSGQESLANTASSIWLPEAHSTSGWLQRNDDTKKKYPCLYCSEEFTCPKERRVHVATLHSHPTVTVTSENKVFSKEEMCLKCGLSLPSENELKLHMKEEHKRVSRQCAVCSEEFASQQLFVEHLTHVHPLECRTCGKTFNSKSSLYVHTKIHMAQKPYACTLCPKSFLSNQKLKEHMNGHTGETPYSCNLCDKKFKRYSNLRQHKNILHLDKKKKTKEFFCDCGETFPSNKKLAWHKELHALKPKQCMYCSERFLHEVSLTRHIRRIHNSHYIPKTENGLKKKNAICPICNQVVMDSSLKIHMKRHNSSSKQFGCIVCGKRFGTKWNLNLHRWTHASRMSKPFKCGLCKGAFVREGHLQVHMRSHFGNKPYTCNHCGQKFSQKQNLHRHEKEHIQDKNYTCGECGKTFHRSYYLHEHLRIHSGLKPFTCHICNKTSSTKSNHNKHLKTHHAREPINSEA